MVTMHARFFDVLITGKAYQTDTVIHLLGLYCYRIKHLPVKHF